MAVILLIESNPRMRPALRDLLQSDGQTVITAMDIPDALSLLSHIKDVDLIVSNAAMPEMDSVALVKRLRSHKQYKSLPMLVFAVSNNSKLRRKLTDAGITDFLAAPFSVADLKKSVDRLLN
jgi:CheY-like chemotaxis protein